MDKTINLSETLSGKLQTNVINEICRIANGDKVMKQNIYALAMGTDEHISYNALWVLSHFDSDSSEWLSMKQNDFIDHVITESHVGKRRILLSILNTQTFTKKSLRTDFIDFCMSKISSPIEQYAIRALCMKLAYKQCIILSSSIKRAQHFPQYVTATATISWSKINTPKYIEKNICTNSCIGL